MDLKSQLETITVKAKELSAALDTTRELLRTSYPKSYPTNYSYYPVVKLGITTTIELFKLRVKAKALMNMLDARIEGCKVERRRTINKEVNNVG